MGFPAGRQDATPADEQIFQRRVGAPLLAARDGMRADEMNIGRQQLVHSLDDFGFNAAHVANDATGLEPR